MKLFLAFWLAMVATSLAGETEAETTFRKGVIGVYGRMDGMVYYSVTLRSDGFYTFTQSDCLTSFPEKGKWVVKDDVVILEKKENVFSHFRILPFGKPADLALLPIDDVSIRGGEKEEKRLFLHRDEKKG